MLTFGHQGTIPEALQRLGHSKLKYNEGLAHICALGGQQCSSTRVEMIGLSNALRFLGAIHVRVDSLSTLRTYWKMLEMATLIEDAHADDPFAKARRVRPLGKRHFSVMKNGDVWRTIWESILSKGAKSLAATKLLWHARQEDVDEVKTRSIDREGSIDVD